MRDKNTPLDLQDRVLEYLSYQQASRLAQTAEDETMMAALSPSLQMELTQSIYVPVLQAIPLFSPQMEFVEDLAMCVAIMTVMPGDLLFLPRSSSRCRPDVSRGSLIPLVFLR